VLATNDWPTLDLITKITYTEKFSLDVAARTTDGSNGASALYYAEASGDWSFDASGTFKLQLNAASPKDSKLQFTADKNPAVKDAGAWTPVLATRKEDIANPAPADWSTARTFS
jgi:hypothetical protein